MPEGCRAIDPYPFLHPDPIPTPPLACVPRLAGKGAKMDVKFSQAGRAEVTFFDSELAGNSDPPTPVSKEDQYETKKAVDKGHDVAALRESSTHL